MSLPSKTIRPAVGSMSLHDGPAERRLPAAGLADDPERLAPQDLEVDPVDCAHRADGVLEDAGLDREVLDETLDPQQRVVRPSPAVVRCRTPSPPLSRSRVRISRPPASAPARAAPRAPRRSDSATVRRALAERAQLRKVGAAETPAVRDRAPGMEAAAGRQRDKARRLPGNRMQPLLLGVQARQAVQEPERVRVPRLVEDRVDVGELDDVAGVHDDDAVCELGDEPEVVRDEDDRRVRLLARGFQHLHDLRLDRHVERGRRLVGDQDAAGRWRSPSRSSPAAACRPRTRAGTGRRGARRRARRRARAAG